MVEATESYSTRFWRRFRRDATPWARDNIVWGFIMLIVPPVAIYLRDPHAQIDWSLVRTTIVLYVFALMVYVIVYLFRTVTKLDIERDIRETALLSDIKERDETINALLEKPTRTVAEQHHYDIAQKALQKLNPDTIIALRHLKTQGKITFGTYPPFLPPGISVNRLVDIYLECAREGLVARQDDSQKGERTFEIAPTMNAVLDELLYENGDR